MSEKFIFALDIGTRSVVGVVMSEGPKGLEIKASDKFEHQTRAMVDGQIHDVEQVAYAIINVKERLEAKIGHPLQHVAVAAAGRALKTVRVKVVSEGLENREIHKADVLRLELQAVQKAQKQLPELDRDETHKQLKYHCVGYSVVQYELDGFRIGSLYSQRGSTIGVEVIATFLPKVVIDSMFAALNKAGLTMTSLTLEPIAASSVVVPQSMRQLNIALVDIGAGTSDIAVTADGSIVGYGMAPVAGDEVTEQISSHYLVDFHIAEEIKKTVLDLEEVKFADILGIEHVAPKQEVLDVISESVAILTRHISEKILELNGKTPQAVICIGGGSQTPLLKDMLADSLGLSRQRVAVRGREAISQVSGAQELVGPEVVTPIGIGVICHENKGLGFLHVTVNGKQVSLFELNRCTVADALVAAGISMKRTQPRLGMALTVTVNGQLKIIKGEKGRPASILLNGSHVTIDHAVQHNDIIEFTEAIDGEPAKGHLYDVVPQLLPMSISVNGKPLLINPVIEMNDRVVTYNDELVDNTTINYYVPTTVKQILSLYDIPLPESGYVIYVNERIGNESTEIADGDDIVIEALEDKTPACQVDSVEEYPEASIEEYGQSGKEFDEKFTEVFPGEAPEESETEAPEESETEAPEESETEAPEESETEAPEEVSGRLSEETFEEALIERPDASEDVTSMNGTMINVNGVDINLDRQDVILADILIRIDMPMRPPEPGMRLEMMLNEAAAEFTTPLKNGDKVTLKWIR